MAHHEERAFDAVVIGGGLAGASTACQLARQGAQVLLVEKRRYPEHKLCGEFLSVEVEGAFERLGVLATVRGAGAVPVRRVRVTTAGGAAFEAALPGTGLGLSRYRLDALLLDHARVCGATVLEGTAVRGLSGTLAAGFTVTTDTAAYTARLVVGAYGKRAALDRRLGRPFLEKDAPRVGFKAHYAGDPGDGALELHAFPGGYCGVLAVEEGRVNVCWIADAALLRAAGGDPEAMIAGACRRNAALGRRMEGLRRANDRFEAVGQVSFDVKGTFAHDVCMVGDAAAMIAPLCGDGMAMALRSAELLSGPAAAFLDGRLSPEAFRAQYVRRWQAAFGRTLRLGRWLHHAYTRPWLAEPGVRLCGWWPGLATRIIRATRAAAPGAGAGGEAAVQGLT